MYFLLAIATLVCTTVASPFYSPPPFALCPKGCHLIVESADPTVNNMYLSEDPHWLDGPLMGQTQEPSSSPYDPALFSVEYAQPKNETLAFHARQSWQATMALRQDMAGFLTLVSLWQPWLYTDTVKEKVEWSVFLMNPRTGEIGVKDESDIPTRKWVAYKNETSGRMLYGLWDGFTKLAHTPIDITIKAEAVL